MNKAELLQQLSHVPEEPGVYMWKDARGTVLYVGKARALRRRMKQYVMGHDSRERIKLMMESVDSFEYVVTKTESESLILEVNLIHQFDPQYNVFFKDDKSFPFIAITLSDPFPGIKFTREKRREGTRYFGPYTDSRAARETIDALRRAIPLCRCTCPEWKRVTQKGGQALDRPCFDSHIGLGPGVCTGDITQSEYAEHVEKTLTFLSGQHDALEDELEMAMREASAELDFELAARYRNRIEALATMRQKQTIVSDVSLNLDVIGIHREETIAGAYVLVVRDGRVMYGNEFVLNQGRDTDFDELIAGFLMRYYGETASVPPEVIVEQLPQDTTLIEGWLSQLREQSGYRKRRVKLTAPSRGLKVRLLTMANQNARHSLLRFKVRSRYDDERINAALVQLESALALDTPPYRIECYDISTLHGTHSVGSMVTFVNGKPQKDGYRRFKVRLGFDEANDVAMMREVLMRRFGPGRADDARFGELPNLIIIDGGKPQLNAALSALDEVGVAIPIAGIAKREEELWLPWSNQPVVLPTGSESLHLIKQVRDEAHRFAIEYHRLLRSKAMTTSVLDEVVGVGPKRRKQIIKHFGSFAKLRQASEEAIIAVPGLPEEIARDIYALLHLES